MICALNMQASLAEYGVPLALDNLMRTRYHVHGDAVDRSARTTTVQKIDAIPMRHEGVFLQ